MKLCRRCNRHKELSEFSKNHKYCKVCQKKYNKAYYHKHRYALRQKMVEYRKTPEAKHIKRIWDLHHVYGITLEQYDEMFTKQNGVCAICGKPETGKNQHGVVRLSVDHNHSTGEVRGLLCTRCNKHLGIIENVDFVQKAQEYLLQKSARPTITPNNKG